MFDTVLVALACFQSFILTKADICTSKICEYHFDVERWQTMVYSTNNAAYNVELNGTDLQIVESSYHPKEYDGMIGQFIDSSDVITGDGLRRDIITVNGQFPGPDIEVLQGCEV